MAEIKINLNCGEKTCASVDANGKATGFCQFVGVRRFGTEHVCRLFPTEDDSFTPLEESGGWLQRCSECISLEKSSFSQNQTSKLG
jgi:hypothetical protein